MEGKTITVQDGERSDTYVVHMLAPLIASDMLTDLLAIIMPAVGAYVGSVEGVTADKISQMLGDEKPGNGDIGGAIALFFSKYNKAQQREFIRILADVTYVGTAKLPVIFDVHFLGRPMAMYKWLLAALKVQFPDFFQMVLRGISGGGRSMVQGL